MTRRPRFPPPHAAAPHRAPRPTALLRRDRCRNGRVRDRDDGRRRVRGSPRGHHAFGRGARHPHRSRPPRLDGRVMRGGRRPWSVTAELAVVLPALVLVLVVGVGALAAAHAGGAAPGRGGGRGPSRRAGRRRRRSIASSRMPCRGGGARIEDHGDPRVRDGVRASPLLPLVALLPPLEASSCALAGGR